MKIWGAIAIYLVAVVLCGAFAAPWIYWGCHWLGGQGDSLSWLAEQRFHDVLKRVLQLCALGGALGLLASQRALSRDTIGLSPSPQAGRQFLFGLGIAIASVALVVRLGIDSRALVWEEDLAGSSFASALVTNLCIGLLVGVMEEIFFRGCLLGWLRRQMHVAGALATVTFFYAITHFLRPPKSVKFVEVHWDTGFTMLGQYWNFLIGNGSWLPEFLMLVLIGLTLGWCFLQTSRLYLSIGLHTGWVFAGKMMMFLTDSNSDVAMWWFGSGKLIGSPITIAVLCAVFLLMIWICRRPMMQNRPHAS